MVTLDARPRRTVNTVDSNWTAGFNPIIYEFTRRDGDINSLTKSGDQIIVSTSSAVNDPIIYIVSGNYKSRAVVDGGIGTNLITVTPDTFNHYIDSVLPGGYYNLVTEKKNYKIEIEIREIGSDNLLAKRNPTPLIDGSLTFDCSDVIRAYFDHEDHFGYDQINKRAVNKSIKFYVNYTEVYDGSSESLISDESNFVFAVDAAKQIGDENGQNMAEHVLYNGPPAPPAKFLTPFEIPVFWEGYPFSVDFIYSEDFPSVAISRVVQERDVNKNPLGGLLTVQLIETEKESVNRLTLSPTVDSFVKFVDLSIWTGAPIVDDYVYPGYVDAGYVESV